MLNRARAASPFGLADLVALIGLIVLAIGLWWIWEPLALVATGAIVMLYAWLAAMPPRTTP